MVLNDPEVQRKVLQDEVLSIKEEASKGDVGGLRTYVEVHKMNANEASEEEILQWIRSVRVFKKRSSKNKTRT